MIMKFQAHGIGSVRRSLRNMAQTVPDGARSQMKRMAVRIVNLAMIYVPEDEGHLRDSIRVEKTYGTRGRLQIDIVAGDATVHTISGREIDLNSYARIIHENYSNMNPGEGTKKKRQAYPGKLIGERFLSRATAEEEKDAEVKIADAIQRAIDAEPMR